MKAVLLLSCLLSAILLSGCAGSAIDMEKLASAADTTRVDPTEDDTTDEPETAPVYAPPETAAETALETEAPPDGIDVDLTKLSSIMVYSEVYNMMLSPDSYIGKIVRMAGTFVVYTDTETGQDYYAVIVQDATACCQQGIEFVWNGDHVYPDDYPELGSDITITGVFGTYQEGMFTYLQLTCDEIVF